MGMEDDIDDFLGEDIICGPTDDSFGQPGTGHPFSSSAGAEMSRIMLLPKRILLSNKNKKCIFGPEHPGY